MNVSGSSYVEKDSKNKIEELGELEYYGIIDDPNNYALPIREFQKGIKKRETH
ncbi:hypothetical protein [[Eubacterium] cellulosolvens]